MRKQLVQVSFRFPACRGKGLMLARTPKYLRFVFDIKANTFDALDQLDDKPKPGEKIVAGIKMNEGSVHVDGVRNGRRFGEWYATASYDACEVQPDAETIRDAAKWQAWCLAEAARHKEGAAT